MAKSVTICAKQIPNCLLCFSFIELHCFTEAASESTAPGPPLLPSSHRLLSSPSERPASKSHRLLPHFPFIAQQPSQPSFLSIAQPPGERGSLSRAVTVRRRQLWSTAATACSKAVRSPFEGETCRGVQGF
ncbi:uncharacterized protein DS421_7g209560 [Arachis hypogaea]|nr:uncharacterized protein DS421_7g209560 [Arachis hypogaea]